MLKTGLKLLLAAYLVLPLSLCADGCFVFRWDKQKDINEPTQKAIIVHDAGREDMILQVKYEGSVEDFGWLIPVPNLPTVEKASMKCFYELSKFTQMENFEGKNYASSKDSDSRADVKVIETKTVGDYDIAVLSPKNAGSLERWLKEHGFSYPKDKSEIIGYYVKKQWYFIAARVNVGDVFTLNQKLLKQGLKAKLSSGELNPLHISFQSETCIFPLKISAVSGKSSEVSLYVLSRTPLLEKTIFNKILARREVDYEKWKEKDLIEREEQSRRFIGWKPTKASEDDRVFYSSNNLPVWRVIAPKNLSQCGKFIPQLKKDNWVLTKQVLVFAPDEMEDLIFTPAVAPMAGLLGTKNGWDSSYRLGEMGTNGQEALVNAIFATNRLARIQAFDVFRYSSFPNKGDVYLKLLEEPQQWVNKEFLNLLNKNWEARFADPLMKCFRDPDWDNSLKAGEVLLNHKEGVLGQVQKLIPMLKDPNPNIQRAALRLLALFKVPIPREELLKLFSSPNANLVLEWFSSSFSTTPVSSNEATPLIYNSEFRVRLESISILLDNRDARAIELGLVLLKDEQDLVRWKAGNMLQEITGQTIPYEQPQKWEEWWAANKDAFKQAKSTPLKN